ncbi:ABC transporter permease [Candidatus Woesearchaeota archaeon]|nr:ABC transporter permease [Candidatus Woesearchaeota archaeon]
MFNPEIIRYTMENIISRKTRSALTILSILIGIAAIFIFASFGLGLYSYVGEIAESSGIDKIIVQARGIGAPGLDDTFKLEESDLEEVEGTKGIKEATAWYVKAIEIEKDDIKKFVFAAGVLPEPKDIRIIEALMGVDIIEGRQLKKGLDGKVVLGYNYLLPDKIFPKPIVVGEKILINDEKFEVIGFYDSIGNPADDANVYLLEDDIKKLFGEDVSYGAIIASAQDVSQIDSTVERVEKNLRKSRDLEEGKEDFFVQTFQDALEMFTNVINIVVGFIFFIVLISAIVAAINTANTMVTSVLERIKEIGVMKSIGARNSTIRDLFLVESGFLGLIAGIFGVFIGWGFSSVGGTLLTELGWGFLSPIFPWWLFAFCIGLAVVVGAVSGVIPAVYASKQKPVDALRYE